MNIVDLQNQRVRFGFERKTGSLIVMENRATGRNYLTDPARGRLFRILCPNPHWSSRYADSQDAPAPSFSKTDGRLTIRYPSLRAKDGPVNIAATVTVELPDDQPEALFQLEIVNRGKERTHDIRFPWIAGWKGFAGPGQDRAHAGIVPIDPYPGDPRCMPTTFTGNHRRSFCSYADAMLLPFVDLSGGGQGLSYICYQNPPRIGGVAFENLDRNLFALCWSFAWAHFPFVKTGESWRSPWIGVGVHRGDWKATADRFRKWLDTWWRPALRRPRMLQKRIGMQIIELRQFDGGPLHRHRDLPRIAADGRRYGVRDLCIFDPLTSLYMHPGRAGRFWKEFDPSQSLNDLRRGLRRVRKQGTHTSLLVNYRLFNANTNAFRHRVADIGMRSLYGSPQCWDYTHCSAHHSRATGNQFLSREGYIMCPRSNHLRSLARRITRQTIDLGFDSIFIDMTYETLACFADHHGHAAPDDTLGAWKEIIQRITASVHRKKADSYVFGENAEISVMQHLDLNFNWFWGVYSPEIIRYTLPEVALVWPVDRQAFVLNRAFIMGFLIGLSTGEVEETLADHPEWGRRVAQLGRLKKRCARYLVEGRFQDRIGLESEHAAAFVHEAPDGIAVTVADAEPKNNRDRTITLTVDPRRLGRRATGSGTLHRPDGRREAGGEWLKDGRVRLKMKLPALEVAIWTIPCAKRKT